MKKVWSSPSLVQCDLMKAMLEGEGIRCALLNENSARFAGVGAPLLTGQALGFAWPEVWVADEDEERAAEVVRSVSLSGGATLPDEPDETAANDPRK